MLEVGSERLLVDLGLFQGRRKEAERRNRALPFDPGTITRALLGHAHIDHCGNLPMLVKNGFRGSIYATHTTRDLVTLMLRDSAYIQARDAEYVNKRERRRGKDRIAPLYDDDDVDATLELFCSRGYNKSFYPLQGVRTTFQPAGHILGSALTLFEVDTGTRVIRIGYVVDLGRAGRPILKDPVQFTDLDVLIIESTYGNRDHEEHAPALERLARIVNAACEERGKVIIPAFALGRTQHIVHDLTRLQEEGRIPNLPVFVDSPLAVDVTGVFKMHPEEFDRETYTALMDGRDPLGYRSVTYVRSVEESKRLNQRSEPCVIISASGMCEAGRILHHLRNSVGDPRNTIVIVGYQAAGTLGERLVQRHEEVRIFGEPFQRRARIETLNAYSAHAGRPDLKAYIEQAGKKLRAVYLVHGEPAPQEHLHAELASSGLIHVHCPDTGAVVDLD